MTGRKAAQIGLDKWETAGCVTALYKLYKYIDVVYHIRG